MNQKYYQIGNISLYREESESKWFWTQCYNGTSQEFSQSKETNKKNCIEVLSSLNSFIINSNVNGKVLLVLIVVLLIF